jgi:hypothetical protein
MLIQKKSNPYITVLKMPSGEEFICKVVDENDTHYFVSKPLTLGQTPQGVSFIPLLMLADIDKNIEIPKPVIIGIPSQEMVSKYESLTSGIALPQKSSIIK